MRLDLDEQQLLMVETANRFFKTTSSMNEMRALSSGVSLPLWRATVDMGFTAMRMATGTDVGGASLFDAALICEQAGRFIAPVPLPDAIAGYRLLSLIGGKAADDILSRAAETPICLLAQDGATLLSTNSEGLVAHNPDGAITLIATGEMALALHAKARAESLLLRTVWLVGAATQALEMAAGYARERKQFDRPIGSFQGVAFPLADSFCEIDGARLLAWHTIWSCATSRENAGVFMTMAQWWAAKSALKAALRSLRTFGGYGLSNEYDIHLYFLAINRMALADGDPERLPEKIGDCLWGEAVPPPLPDAEPITIETGMGQAADRIAEEARAFFDAELTPQLRGMAHHSTAGHDPEFHRKLAKAGLAYPGWPKQWGGRDASPMEVTAVSRVIEEYRWSRTAIGITNMGAKMVMQFGSPELQAEVLPPLARGDALSCLGFTEPEAGSDMFATRTKAVRDDKDWIISGQKMFTTGAHIANYVLLITRTSSEKPKHKGLTIFFVPMSLQGIAIQPVYTLQDEQTNITFYDEVRVPDRYRLGEVDGGIAVLAAAMQIEHGGEGYHAFHHSLMDAAMQWAHAKDANGSRPIDDRIVRARLARAATHLELADLLCRRATHQGAAGTATRASGPISKLFATEIYMRDAADLTALAAPASLHHETVPLAEIETKQRQSISQTIYGGTSEIHRGIIAQYALNLPHST